MSLTINGIQQAQQGNNKVIAALKPGSAFGRAVQYATSEAHRYAVSITHVHTGALRASHRMSVQGLHGSIYLDPSARNPRSNALTSVYGPVEEARGGSHAFYKRTQDEAGPRIAEAAIAGFVRGI
jgi:hypothetical protein